MRHSFLLLVFLLFENYICYSCDTNLCKLPACQCASSSPPNNMNPNDVPQFIVLTFDDAVSQYILEAGANKVLLAHADRNGCPIPATFYVSLQYTDFYLLQVLKQQGHEIAIHTVDHVGNPGSEEILQCREAINKWTGGSIKNEELVGFRAPFLQLNANTASVLQNNGFLYDSSVSTDPDNNNLYPYTLDNGYAQTTCDNEICKGIGKFPGLWHVPMWSIHSTSNIELTSMDYVDQDMYGSFMKTFYEKYNGNRSPMGIFLHPAWLIASDDNVNALNKFIETVLQMKDVYFVTNKQLVEYMKNPVPAANVASQLKGDGVCINGRRFPSAVSNEVCDGADNDRNGLIDENGIRSCVYPSFTIRTCLPTCPSGVPVLNNVFPQATGNIQTTVSTSGLNLIANPVSGSNAKTPGTNLTFSIENPGSRASQSSTSDSSFLQYRTGKI
ncbi:hypothetical protein ROZALSC1DRAFT_27410 [Rozella allomycis CSF55]|uniref:NodB homology domain-containing protein n=1 Tax=Rozella allomycis (strain CSF55) TaxID=988480 RepID=A0A4P9YPG9_ROZAC|nr:hypothetical protein ROZALSC1DRAFT_27410 [Rozella allomycis CSF55]